MNSLISHEMHFRFLIELLSKQRKISSKICSKLKGRKTMYIRIRIEKCNLVKSMDLCTMKMILEYVNVDKDFLP